jgi:hypothetical protein
MFISSKLLVSDATARVARNDAIRYCKLLVPLSEFHRSETQQGFASGGCGKCKTFRVKVCRSRLASRGSSLIRTDRCITLDQLDSSNWNAQLLRDQLGLSRINSLTEIAFPGKRGDDSVGTDG